MLLTEGQLSDKFKEIARKLKSLGFYVAVSTTQSTRDSLIVVKLNEQDVRTMFLDLSEGRTLENPMITIYSRVSAEEKTIKIALRLEDLIEDGRKSVEKYIFG